jgi:hypothetical protein
VESEKVKSIVPDSPGIDGVDEDLMNTKIAEGFLNSLANAVPNANVVPDAPTSLAQAQPQPVLGEHVEDEAEENVDNVVAVTVVHQEKDADVTEHTNKDMSVEEDLVIVKTVGVSKKKSGKTGVVTTVWQVHQSVVE